MEVENIKINNVSTQVIDSELIEALNLYTFVSADKIIFDKKDVITIGDFKNRIILSDISHVKIETGFLLGWEYEIWFRNIEKPNDIESCFECKYCKEKYQGKPNFQIRNTNDFVCDNCRFHDSCDNVDYIPILMSKMVYDSVRITVNLSSPCDVCGTPMDKPQFRTYGGKERYACSEVCALDLGSIERIDVFKWQKKEPK